MAWQGLMRGYMSMVRQERHDLLMRLRQKEREVVGAQRRVERETARQRKELLAEMREAEKLGEQARAKHEVALYENYLSTLVSVHKECSLPWSWEQVASSPPPPAPMYMPITEPQAYAALASYVPSALERMTSQDAVRRSELQMALEAARQHDRGLYQQALEQHRFAYSRWEWLRNVAGGMLAGDANAFGAVIENLGPFEELGDLNCDVRIAVPQPWCAEATVTVSDAEVVPNEIYSLLASGKVGKKKMPQGRYWELYQDHVCSCALRVARELLALLPIDLALVHVHGHALNKATGHQELLPLLSVGFDRATLNRLNLDVIVPSNSMRNFTHHIDFKKTSGLLPVERLPATEFRPTSARWGGGAR